LVSGSLRVGSTNGAALATAQSLIPAGSTAVLYGGLADLPHFNPDHDRVPLSPAVAELRAALAAADAVLFSTPEYAGSLPGSFKNLLDWTVGEGMYRKPVGWINASAQGAADGAYDTLRVVLGYVSAGLVKDACVKIPVRRDVVGPDGLITDRETKEAIRAVVVALVTYAANLPRE
jgi:NAD(P)H-dependent FMN reductase